MTIPVFDDYCFACGRLNPIGLKMAVTYSETELSAAARLRLAREFQGWQEMIHGGILATLLDEIMAHAIWKFVGPAVTLGLEVQYRRPLAPEEEILVQGRLLSNKGRRLTAAGEIIRVADQLLIATGRSRFLLPGAPAAAPGETEA